VYIFGGHARALYDAEAEKSAIFAARPATTGPSGTQLLARYEFGAHQRALYDAEATKSRIFPAQPTPTAETSTQILARYQFGTHQKTLYDAEALKSRLWAPLAVTQGFITWSTLSGPEEVDLSNTVYGRVWPTATKHGIAGSTVWPIPPVPPQAYTTVAWAKVWQSVPTPQVTGQTVRPVPPVPPQIDPSLPWTQVWQSWKTAPGPITGPTVAPLPSVPPQTDPNTAWARVWQSLTPTITGPTIRPLPAVPPQTDPNVPWTAVWTLITPVLGPTVRPANSVPPQTDPSIPWARVWQSLSAIITGPTVTPIVSIPPQIDPNVVWARVWETVVIPEILGPTVRPLPPVPPQVDTIPAWMRAWPAVAVPPPITGPTVLPIFFAPQQFDPSISPSIVWTYGTFAPGPPPPVGYLTIYEANNELATAGYITDPLYIYEYSSVVPNNYVIEFVTVPGAITYPIRLVVSLGPPNPATTTAIPNVIGQELTFAQQNITAASLGLGTVNYVNNAAPNGQVIAQIPPAAGSVALWTQVSLYVSSGPLITYPGGTQPVVPT
jgi:PASTA domain